MKRAALLAVMLAAALTGCGGPSTHGGRIHSRGFGKPPVADYGLGRPVHRFAATPGIPGYDAVTLANVPRSAQAVGCYASGHYVNCAEARTRFPHAHIVNIATWAGAVARCLDVEPGDAVPSQTGGWVHSMYYTHHYYRPCIYSDASEMADVRVSLRAWGDLTGTDLWLADWDGNPAVPPGYLAKQWASDCCVDRDTFAPAFFATASKPRPTCFGPAAQLGNPTCQRVRSDVAKWSRARDATAHAIIGARHGLTANRCRTPYRRDVCIDLGREIIPPLRARERYFAGKVAATIRAYS